MRLMYSVVLAILPGCVISVHEGDGVPATQVLDVGSFDGVANETSVDVAILYGPTHAAALTCDENLLDLIEVTVQNGALTVRTERDGGQWIQLDPRTDCVLEVVAPALSALSATGSGDVEVVGDTGFALQDVSVTGSGDVLVHPPITVDGFEAAVTGSGTLEVDSLSAEAVGLSSTGSGGLSVSSGAAGLLELSGTGSGDLLARGLVAGEVEASLTGSGDGEVTATERITASLTGSGDLTVWGDPAEREVSSTGSGDVSFAD